MFIRKLANIGLKREMKGSSVSPERFVWLYEFSQKSDKSIKTRINMAKRGYRSEVLDYYDLEEYNLEDYISLREKEKLCAEASKEDILATRNKTETYKKLSDYSEISIPDYCATEHCSEEDIKEFFSEYERQDKSVIVKDENSDQGESIQKVDSYSEFKSLNTNGVLLNEMLEVPAWQRYFSPGLSTTRILTVRDENSERWEAVSAIQRIPSPDSLPTDNWHQGGFSAQIKKDGELGLGMQMKQYDSYLRKVHFGKIDVPNLETAFDAVEEASSEFDSCRILGWDVVLYEDSVYLLEVNCFVGLRSFQIHEPLRPLIEDSFGGLDV